MIKIMLVLGLTTGRVEGKKKIKPKRIARVGPGRFQAFFAAKPDSTLSDYIRVESGWVSGLTQKAKKIYEISR